MPNLAFHLEVLKLVTSKLVGDSDPHGDIMAKHKKFAALGALGPDLLRYLPVDKSVADYLGDLASQPFGQGVIWKQPAEFIKLFQRPLGGAYSVLFRHLVIPTWPVLNRIKAFLDQMDLLASNQNLLALPLMISQANTIQAELTALKSQQLPPGLISVIAQIFALPPLMQVDSQKYQVPPQLELILTTPFGNRYFEFLRWHGTGKFARSLLTKAATNQQHQAYAYGYLSHLAASVTAEPFVNNITGGPYRTYWARNQLVSNFIDSWTYGFYNTNGASVGTDDQPSPPYAAWKPLCSANIQEEFNVAGLLGGKAFDVPDAVKAMASGDLGNLPNQFPTGFNAFLNASVNHSWGFLSPKPFGLGFGELFNEASIGAYAIFWFMTSGSGPMCNNPIGPPPPGCMSPPSWVTAPPTSVGAALQAAGINVGAAACAVLLAISSVILLLTGNITLGIIALLLALNQPIIDWDQIRCHIYWLRKMLVDVGNGLRYALVWSAMAYPPPEKLGTIDVNGKTQPASDWTIGPGVPLCRTNSKLPLGQYPKRMDETFIVPGFHYPFFPPATVLVEDPPTKNLVPDLVLDEKYPNFVVNGSPAPPGGGIMFDQVTPALSTNTFFGDAVSNAFDVIKDEANGLQHFNLDADRGYGWKTWNPAAGSVPANPPVLVDKEL